LGEYLYIALANTWCPIELPLGYIYIPTSSMDGEDLFDPTTKIVHPEYSVQFSSILHSSTLV